ncbi:MAG TPA: hypothetical protein VMD09_07305 [Solirubrobacteraceae bacterium]|nr:hypothetical protein [Solirubrobacteraceae bacterium]
MAATLLAVAGCGTAANGSPSAPAVQRVGSATLVAGAKGLSRPLPTSWMIRLRAWFADKRSTLRLELGSSTVMVFDGSHIWHRVEVTKRGVVVDGRRTGASELTASSVTLRAGHGPVEIRDLVISRTKP